VDLKALLRITAVYGIPIARNPFDPDFLMSSPLKHRGYERSFDDQRPSSRAAIA
jgi:methylglyoxal synthase